MTREEMYEHAIEAFAETLGTGSHAREDAQELIGDCGLDELVFHRVIPGVGHRDSTRFRVLCFAYGRHVATVHTRTETLADEAGIRLSCRAARWIRPSEVAA